MDIVRVADTRLMAPPKRGTTSFWRACLPQKIRLVRQTKVCWDTFRQALVQTTVIVQRPLAALDITMDTDRSFKAEALACQLLFCHRFKVLIPLGRINHRFGRCNIWRIRAAVTVKSATALHHAFKRRKSRWLRWRIRQKRPKAQVIHPAPVVPFLVTMVTDLVAYRLYGLNKRLSHFPKS
jgi:hypothetical protein